MPLLEVKVSVLDRGFLFGDAVYEVIRLYSGKAWMVDRHLGRLETGLTALKIAGVDISVVRQRMNELIAASQIQDGLIYIQITRGEAKRMHRYPGDTTANQLIWLEPFDDPYKQVRSLGTPVISYPDYRWKRNDLKVTSLIANCMAAQAANEKNCLEVIQVDANGFITEGSHTSIFAVKNGEIMVSPAGPQVLPGITKMQILDLANQAKIGICEGRLTLSDLATVEEMFLTGTPEEIVPITAVDDIKIGAGVPGIVTRKLQEVFRLSIKNFVEGS